MNNTRMSYKAPQAIRSFTVCRSTIAVTLGTAILFLVGCKGQQLPQRENADQLTAQLLDASAEYRKACQTPSDAVSKAAVHDAMGSATPAQQRAHFDQAQAESKARLASPACQQLAAKRDAISARLNVALKAGAPQ